MSTLRTPVTGSRSSWLQFFRGVSSAEKRPPSSSQSTSFVPQMVAAWAAEKRRAPAVTGAEGRLSYVELEAQSNALARYLHLLGAKPEVPVALFMERSPGLLLSALAVMKAGAAFLPLDPSYPAERIGLILKDARAPIVLTTSTRKAELPAGPWMVVDLTNADSLLRTYSARTLACDVQPSQLAYVIFASGSTGRPKGVEITHSNLLNLVEWHQCTFGVSGADRATLLASPGFDASVWESWPYLAAGASLHVPSETTRVSPRALRDWMLANEITISFVPTPLAERLLALDWPADTPLRFLLTGGDVLHQYPRAGLPFALVNNYGPTECTVVAASGVVSSNSHSGTL